MAMATQSILIQIMCKHYFFFLKKNLECPLVSVQKSKYYFQGFLTLKTRVTDITCLQRNISLSKFNKCVP